MRRLDARHAARLEAIAVRARAAARASQRPFPAVARHHGGPQAGLLPGSPRAIISRSCRRLNTSTPPDFGWAPRGRGRHRRDPEELRAVLAEGLGGIPALYPVRSAPASRIIRCSTRRDWSALFLCENGKSVRGGHRPLPEDLGGGPGGAAALDRAIVADGDVLAAASGRSDPRRIRGVHNTRLICHLPLIVPPGCGFRVGNEVRRVGGGQASRLRRHDRA